MDPFNTAGSYWDLAQQPANFSSLADDDFLALLQKQFPSSLAAAPSPKPPFDFSSLSSIPPDGGVDPQSITTFPLPNPSPPSSDTSSPSPSSMNNDPPSRPRSGANNHDDSPDDHSLKRKASDESMDDEPTHKSPHGSSAHSRKASTSARRKSGNPHQDEVRLMKRKEQNRAAQRAFRERKEKHVKDLEDKVSALEAVNQEKQNENDNLRDLLSRLQSENMALKQGGPTSPSSLQSPSSQFTFSVPKPGPHGMQQMNMSSLQALSSYMTPHPPPQSMLSPPASSYASPAMSAASSSNSPPNNSFDFSFGQLIPFDPASLSSLDEPAPPTSNGIPQTATDGAMSIDYGFGPLSGGLPYKTIASNPMFMSFGEPMDTSTSASSPYTEWNSPALQEVNAMNGGIDPLDQLFGGNYMGAQSPVDFSALLRSPPSSVAGLRAAGSNMTHLQPQAALNTFASITSSASTPGASSSSSSGLSSSSSDSPNPNSPMGNDLSCQVLGSALPNQISSSMLNGGAVHVANGAEHKKDECPKTKEDMRKVIIQQGQSAFVNPMSSAASSPHSPSSMTMSPTPAPLSPSSSSPTTMNGANIGFVKKVADAQAGGGNVVMCKGSSFPKTEMSDKNIEVLTAWRTITSNPQFKDVDINELCTEFTSKARCDGTKVVLEPEGVNHIMQTLAARKMAQLGQS